MEQELISKSVAIIGGGPAGCMCAKILADNGFDVTVFEKNKILATLLPTGGGKCNLAHAQYDFRELAKNYPRGEKFLYSLFSRFSTGDTVEFFKNIGVETYTREDNRIFPVSNSAQDVRAKFIASMSKKIHITKELVTNIYPLDNGYKILTAKSSYFFDIVVVAIGGHSSWKILDNLSLNLIEPVASLVGMTTKEDLSSLAGVRVDDVQVKVDEKIYQGDILFTHRGVSGPVIYTISSIFARKIFPYEISIRFAQIDNFQEELNSSPHKTVENLLKNFIPKALAIKILELSELNSGTTCAQVRKTQRNLILENLEKFKLTVNGKVPNGEVVTCGGVDLKEINSKTLEAKKYNDLYFCGEVLDIDGFCGGFNLQNCWSGGYVVAQEIISRYK